MRSFPRLSLQALVIAVLLATFTRTFVAQGVHVPTASMEPAILAGDHLLVGKLIYQEPRHGLLGAFRPSRRVGRGDVLVFRSPTNPSTLLVKRCVGLPGEVISITGRQVAIDGRPLEEGRWRSPVIDLDGSDGRHLPPQRIPENHYFALGDDRRNSFDSRDFGPIPHSAIVGRAALVYWSFRSLREEDRSSAARTIGALFRNTRWERTFRAVR